MSDVPDGYAVIQPDGHFVGIWQQEKSAKNFVNRSPASKNEVVLPMVYAYRLVALQAEVAELHEQLRSIL